MTGKAAFDASVFALSTDRDICKLSSEPRKALLSSGTQAELRGVFASFKAGV